MNDYLKAKEQCKAVNGVMFLNLTTGVYQIEVDYWTVLKCSQDSNLLMFSYQYK